MLPVCSNVGEGGWDGLGSAVTQGKKKKKKNPKAIFALGVTSCADREKGAPRPLKQFVCLLGDQRDHHTTSNFIIHIASYLIGCPVIQ